MSTNQKDKASENSEAALPVADTGNASNPSPHNEAMEPAGNQLLSEGAEKYLREAGNIEDMPDAQAEEEMDETIEEQKEK